MVGSVVLTAVTMLWQDCWVAMAVFILVHTLHLEHWWLYQVLQQAIRGARILFVLYPKGLLKFKDAHLLAIVLRGCTTTIPRHLTSHK